MAKDCYRNLCNELTGKGMNLRCHSHWWRGEVFLCVVRLPLFRSPVSAAGRPHDDDFFKEECSGQEESSKEEGSTQEEGCSQEEEGSTQEESCS